MENKSPLVDLPKCFCNQILCRTMILLLTDIHILVCGHIVCLLVGQVRRAKQGYADIN